VVGAEEYDLWGEAERSETVQFLEEKKHERSTSVYNYLIGGHRDNGARLFSKLQSSRIRGNVH